MSSAVRRGRRSKRPCAISWPTTRATPRSLLDGRHSRAQFSKRKRSNAMRKIIEYCLVSADGIVLDDPFPFQDYLDDAYLRDRLGLFEACDPALWGRTPHQRFAKRWGGGEDTPPSTPPPTPTRHSS